MVRTIITLASVITVATLTVACSQRTVHHRDFGETVRGVMNSQIHDYEAAIHPNPDAVEGSDPNRLNTVLETYRDHVTKPEQVQQPISISVGSD